MTCCGISQSVAFPNPNDVIDHRTRDYRSTLDNKISPVNLINHANNHNTFR